MTTDIVERLRTGVYGLDRIALCAEAASEIERLRAEVERHREKALSLGADLMHRDATIGQLSREASMLRAEVESLREACAEAYQVVGAGMLGEPAPYTEDDVVRALDNLSAAMQGLPRPHDDLLPWPRYGGAEGPEQDAEQQSSPLRDNDLQAKSGSAGSALKEHTNGR